MSAPLRFVLRRLAFTGPAKPTSDLLFAPGLTVIWGGSQAGKSFAVKALDHMFGSGSDLPEFKEAVGYDRCWLELELPRSGRVTLARSLSRGAYDLFDGGMDGAFGGTTNRFLSDVHRSGGESLSSFMLNELGIGHSEIAKTLSGERVAFSMRHFASYMFTEETPMISEESPITIDRNSGITLDKNVLKFILTGVDDRSIARVPAVREQRQANSGRIEIVEEMLDAASAELAAMYPGTVDLETLALGDQAERLGRSIDEFRARLATGHSALDSMMAERRRLVLEREASSERLEEVVLTIGRFELLATSFGSDIRRLTALEEGAAALMAAVRLPCVLCGADPQHQHFEHGFRAVETSQKAVAAELRKVRAESSGLVGAIATLRAEAFQLEVQIENADGAVGELESQIHDAKAGEAQIRSEYELLDAANGKLREALSLERRIADLRTRLAALVRFKAKAVPRGTVVAGVGSVVGDELAAAAEAVFRAWKYPGTPRITFDEKTHDLLLDGKRRNANGKGVRALLNTAFKIAVLDVCRKRGLPHPGIVALDSPLLTYRDPLTSKHRELSADERTVVAAGLNTHFYRYLIDRSADAQFIVLENQDPPFALPETVREYRFAGEHGTEGRRGLL